MPVAAIFADTQWEPQRTYDHLAWLMSPNVLPFPVRIATAGSIRENLEFIARLYGLDRRAERVDQALADLVTIRDDARGLDEVGDLVAERRERTALLADAVLRPLVAAAVAATRRRHSSRAGTRSDRHPTALSRRACGSFLTSAGAADSAAAATFQRRSRFPFGVSPSESIRSRTSDAVDAVIWL